MNKISHIRNDYNQGQLNRIHMDTNPVVQFKKWLNEAIEKEVLEPTAMCLSTVDEDNIPHSRIVLLKDIADNKFTFFTNYDSEKGLQISTNPMVSVNFFWPEMERQVRIIGKTAKTSTEVSDEYFKSRPVASRLGAWASPQSRPVDDDFVLKEFEKMASMANEKTNERPPYWGGYAISPIIIEFWQGRSNRLHDRFKYMLIENGEWHMVRLAP
jgi:pyridoxamine 5'-phosphate oxidase